MKKKWMKYLLIIMGIILLMNIPPVSWLFRLFDRQDLEYSNASGSFTFSEMNYQQRNYRMCSRKWDFFKATGNPDTIVFFRITPNNYWKIWNYADYLFSEKYKHPYRSWKSIEAARHPNRPTSGYQDF